MNYMSISKCDILNGEGLRVVLWCAGCSLHCKKCQNIETWNKDNGYLFDKKAKKIIFNELNKTYVKGLTLTGGHPLEEYNLIEVTKLCKEVKEKYPNKDIWCWTGYIYEDIKNYEIMKYIDILVDGAYVDELRNVTLKWRGSENQRVIDVKKSQEENKTILYCD